MVFTAVEHERHPAPCCRTQMGLRQLSAWQFSWERPKVLNGERFSSPQDWLKLCSTRGGLKLSQNTWLLGLVNHISIRLIVMLFWGQLQSWRHSNITFWCMPAIGLPSHRTYLRTGLSWQHWTTINIERGLLSRNKAGNKMWVIPVFVPVLGTHLLCTSPVRTRTCPNLFNAAAHFPAYWLYLDVVMIITRSSMFCVLYPELLTLQTLSKQVQKMDSACEEEPQNPSYISEQQAGVVRQRLASNLGMPRIIPCVASDPRNIGLLPDIATPLIQELGQTHVSWGPGMSDKI